jgi:hypothetical protein
MKFKNPFLKVAIGVSSVLFVSIVVILLKAQNGQVKSVDPMNALDSSSTGSTSVAASSTTGSQTPVQGKVSNKQTRTS